MYHFINDTIKPIILWTRAPLKHIHTECQIIMNITKVYYPFILHGIYKHKKFNEIPFEILLPVSKMLSVLTIHHITYNLLHIYRFMTNEWRFWWFRILKENHNGIQSNIRSKTKKNLRNKNTSQSKILK